LAFRASRQAPAKKNSMTNKSNSPAGDSGGLAGTISRNTIFGIFSNGAQVATRLVTVPIVIYHLGLGGYGIWNIIMTTATYMRFGSVGVKTAFQKYVAEATGNGDYEKASKLLSTGFAIMLVLSVAGLIPLSFFSHQIAAAAGVPPEFLKSAAGAISLLALIMVMANVGATYEAIVMGGHRIDLVRKYSTALTVGEAIGIVAVLHFGYGLFAMAAVMGASELAYIVICYFAASRVLPQLTLGPKYVTTSVVYELFRFAGSYQVLNLLEILYNSILPFAILRSFGATEAGVLAVVNRVVTSAVILQEAFLPPILSGGAMVFASGSIERLKTLLAKAFKATAALSLFPLGFICAFGTTMAYAWTGQRDQSFRMTFWLICLTSLFRSFSLLGLVLYRTSGRALLDNLRQVLRIVVILAVVWFSPRLGFEGSLAGLAFAEFSGLIFMLVALSKTFDVFKIDLVLPDLIRMTIAAGVILAAGLLVNQIPFPPALTASRLGAALKLVVISVGCLIVAWPALSLTGSVTRSESQMLLSVFQRKSRTDINAAV
jgi:O-antigen/teichoic acid export membrane protein